MAGDCSIPSDVSRCAGCVASLAANTRGAAEPPLPDARDAALAARRRIRGRRVVPRLVAAGDGGARCNRVLGLPRATALPALARREERAAVQVHEVPHALRGRQGAMAGAVRVSLYPG